MSAVALWLRVAEVAQGVNDVGEERPQRCDVNKLLAAMSGQSLAMSKALGIEGATDAHKPLRSRGHRCHQGQGGSLGSTPVSTLRAGSPSPCPHPHSNCHEVGSRGLGTDAVARGDLAECPAGLVELGCGLDVFGREDRCPGIDSTIFEMFADSAAPEAEASCELLVVVPCRYASTSSSTSEDGSWRAVR